jgi:hypothetical protein
VLRNKFVLISFLLLLAFSFPDCSKSNNNNGTAPASSFTWTHDGTNYMANVSGVFEHSVALVPFYIVAIIGTNININFTRKVEFSLTAFNTGGYAITSGGMNLVHYIGDGGFDYSGIGGSVNITSNTNNLLSGNFSVTMAGPGPNTTLSGSFSNMPIQP